MKLEPQTKCGRGQAESDAALPCGLGEHRVAGDRVLDALLADHLERGVQPGDGVDQRNRVWNKYKYRL